MQNYGNLTRLKPSAMQLCKCSVNRAQLRLGRGNELQGRSHDLVLRL